MRCRMERRDTLAAFFRPRSRCDPLFILPSSATLFLYPRPRMAVKSLHRQTVHEGEAREGSPEASLKRMDVAEERLGLHERTRHMNKW